MPDPLSDEGLYNVWPDPIQPTDTQIVITSGVPLDLAQVIPGAGTALTVYGDVVSVSKDIRFDSGALTIYARQIATTSPITIDVSGTDGQGYAPGDAAAGGRDDYDTDGGNGGSGSPGKNGSSATSSGAISIYAESYSGPVLTLRANGGKGGRGQDGGRGGRAGNGQNGGSAQAPQEPGEQPQGYQTYNGSPGQPGGTGGQGGAPGWGGSGGSAGQIVFSLATRLPSAGTIDAQSNGGAIGDLGTPGTGGSSGTGGSGGANVQCLYAIGESGGQVWICSASGQGQNCTDIDAQEWCVDAPPFQPNGASPGPPPPAPPPAPPAPLAGATLTPALQGSVAYASLATKIPDAAHLFAWLETIMHATQRYFLAGQYKDTALRLSWLINITASAPAIAGWSPDNTTELSSLHQYCLTLMARLSSGLDFYGYPPNHISTISFHAYQDDLNSMVTLGSIVETAYKTYFQEAQTDEVRRAQIAGQISSDQAAITNWQNQITSTSVTVKKTQDDLSALSGQIQAYKQVLMTTDMQQFRLAVYNGEGCTWTMVLTAVGAILGVATGVGDIASLASAAALAEEAAKEASTLSNILKMISVVSYDLSNIANGFASISTVLSQSGPDAGKLLTSLQDLQQTEAQFDSNMQPFLNNSNPDIAAAAKTFQQQIHGYFDLIQSYNKKLLDINSLQVEILRLQAKIAKKQKEIARLQTAAVGDYDPTVAPYAAYMGQAYATMRDQLLQQTYYECRAFEYWALQPLPLSQVLGSGAPLAVTVADFANVQNQIILLKEQVQSSRGADKPLYQDLELSLPVSTFSHIRTEPATQKHYVTFDIPPALPTTLEQDSPFHGKAVVGFTQVQAWVTGAKTTDNNLSVSLIHSGAAAIVNTDGTLWNFTHDPLTVPFQYNTATGVVTTPGIISQPVVDQDDYINYSPFTTWVLVLDPSPTMNSNLDVTQVSAITIKFSGNAFSFLQRKARS